MARIFVKDSFSVRPSIASRKDPPFSLTARNTVDDTMSPLAASSVPRPYNCMARKTYVKTKQKAVRS
jgi:hypothetical protein